MRCEPSLDELARDLLSARHSLVELLSILLAIRDLEPVGRTLLSRILGYGDKKTRNLIRELSTRNMVIVTRAGALLGDKARRLLSHITCTPRNEYTVAIAPCDISDASILRLRDLVVLSLGDPDLLVAIGYNVSGTIEFPGIPPSYAHSLTNLAKDLADRMPTALAIFRNPRCYHCCSSFLHALFTSSNRSATMSRIR